VPKSVARICSRKYERKIVDVGPEVGGQRTKIQSTLDLGECLRRSVTIECFDERDAIEGSKGRGLRRRPVERYH